jgi:phosphatidylserine/phosphatidylglycerophosphate/cardiolipin synthase-like enzyme
LEATAGELDWFALGDGRQPADVFLDRMLAFIAAARSSLEIAIYDLRLPDDLLARLREGLADRRAAGVMIRLVYNGPRPPRPRYPPPPRTDPVQVESLGVDARSIPGVPDLMHHKYVVRDRAAVWTGSTNWTGDSWTREENIALQVPSNALAADYLRNFEELWQKGRVEASGHFDGAWATAVFAGEAVRCRAVFSPGRGRAMSHLYARRIGQARRRLRICSPVLTSGPVLGSLAEVPDSVDTTVVYDRTQMAEVLQQWGEQPQSAWKAPLFTAAMTRLRSASKVSTPYGEGSVHDFMHAKLVVADDVVLAGSYNISHSGEMNAENVVEIESPALADQLAGAADEIFARYR